MERKTCRSERSGFFVPVKAVKAASRRGAGNAGEKRKIMIGLRVYAARSLKGCLTPFDRLRAGRRGSERPVKRLSLRAANWAKQSQALWRKSLDFNAEDAEDAEEGQNLTYHRVHGVT